MTAKKLLVDLNKGRISLHIVNGKFTVIFDNSVQTIRLFKIKDEHLFNVYNLLNNIKNDWYIKDYNFSDSLTCNDKVRLRYIRDKYGINFDRKAIEKKIATRVLAKRGVGKTAFNYC